jgi:hypothetical protein
LLTNFFAAIKRLLCHSHFNVLNAIQHNRKVGQFFGAAKVREIGGNKGIKVNLTAKFIKSFRDLNYLIPF